MDAVGGKARSVAVDGPLKEFQAHADQRGDACRRAEHGDGQGVADGVHRGGGPDEGTHHEEELAHVADAAVPAEPRADAQDGDHGGEQRHTDAVVEVGGQAHRAAVVMPGLVKDDLTGEPHDGLFPEGGEHGPHGGDEDDQRKRQQEPRGQDKEPFAAFDPGQFARIGTPREQGDPEGKGDGNEDEEEQRDAHAAGTEGMHGLHHAAADKVGGEERRNGGERHKEDVHAVQLVAARLDEHGVQGRRSDEPRDEGGVFHRVPCPVAAPAELHVGPPAAEHDARGKHGPRRQREGPGHIRPCRLIGVPAAQRLGEGETAGDHEPAITEEQQRGMEDHAGVLEQGVQPVAVLRHGMVHEEGIVPRHEDEPEEAHDAEVKDPVPEPRVGGQALIGTGELEQPAADGYGESPEQHGAGLSRPEGRNAVEERQQPVGVARHIDQGEVVARQRIYKDSGRDDVTPRQAQVGLFDEAEARNGGAALGLARSRGRPRPQRFDGPQRPGECAEHGEREKDESEIIHGSSKLSGISSRKSGPRLRLRYIQKAAPPASHGARRAGRQAGRRFGAGRRSASVFLLILGRALGHERFGLKRTVRPEPPFHNDFRTDLEGVRDGARVLNPQRSSLVLLIFQPEPDVSAGFGARKPVLGNGAEEAGGLQLIGGGGKRFGDIEEIDAVFGKAGIRKIADASQKQEKRYEIDVLAGFFCHGGSCYAFLLTSIVPNTSGEGKSQITSGFNTPSRLLIFQPFFRRSACFFQHMKGVFPDIS